MGLEATTKKWLSNVCFKDTKWTYLVRSIFCWQFIFATSTFWLLLVFTDADQLALYKSEYPQLYTDH